MIVFRASASASRCVCGLEARKKWSVLERFRTVPFPPLTSVMQLLQTLHQLRCMFLPPRLQIKIRKDRMLDSVADKEKLLKPIIGLRDTILRFRKASVPVKVLFGMRRRHGLKISEEKFENLMLRYPNVFEMFEHPDEKRLWCKVAPPMLKLLQEERLLYRKLEPCVVEKLQKLLMLATDHRIPTHKLKIAAQPFGLPSDFEISIVPNYPEHFRLLTRKVQGRKIQMLELSAWNDSLAITEIEKREKNRAKQKGWGDIETNGRPIEFKLSYSPGTQLKKKIKIDLREWQRLPYVSPYQNTSWVEEGTALHDRLLLSHLHELLSLTIEKKILLKVIGAFQHEFKLSEKVVKTFNRFPGAFYVSLKGGFHTIFLREAYHKKRLVVEHPLISLKYKYYRMLSSGPRLRSLCGHPLTAALEGTVDISGDEMDEDGDSLAECIDNETLSDLDDSNDEHHFFGTEV